MLYRSLQESRCSFLDLCFVELFLSLQDPRLLLHKHKRAEMKFHLWHQHADKNPFSSAFPQRIASVLKAVKIILTSFLGHIFKITAVKIQQFHLRVYAHRHKHTLEHVCFHILKQHSPPLFLIKGTNLKLPNCQPKSDIF